MMLHTLRNTQFAKTSGWDRQIDQVVRFLVMNRGICLSSELVQQIAQTRAIIQTPMSTLFERMVFAGCLKQFVTVYPAGKNNLNVPDLLTMPGVCIDLAEVAQNNVLASFDEMYNKILVNVSGLVRLKEDGRTPQILDLGELQSLYVRGLLCRSYNASNGWLTPSLGLFIAESYSMALSSVMQRLYTLTYAEQLTVAGILALYMCQMLSASDDDQVTPPLFRNCTWIGHQADLLNLTGRASHLSQDGLTVEKVCQLIVELGPERMRNFNSNIFYRSCSGLGSDSVSTRIAFEYPAYWVHQLILTLSGAKVPMAVQLKQHRLMDKGKLFLRDLLYTKSFIDQWAD